MNITQIDKNLKNLTASFSKADFIYDLLLAYGLPKAALLSSGDQDWSAINPDVFASIFQSVISTGQRSS